MPSPQQWDNLIGATAVDAEGNKIGKIGQIYVSDTTNEPEWVTVSTGLFGTRESFAPLYNAQIGDEEVRLAVTKDLIKDAPNVDDDGHLDDSELDALYQHYAGNLNVSAGQAYGNQAGDDAYVEGTGRAVGDDGTSAAGTGYEGQTGAGYAADGAERSSAEYTGTAGTGQAGTEYAGTGTGVDETAGRDTDDAMTRSEERLHVGTETVQAGRARLRKYVVTENVTQTVPVSHEEVRLEREPITDANRDAAVTGEPISEDEHEVTLHAERPVVEKEAVPVERVRLGTETVTEQHEVNEQVRKEQIEEPDVDTGIRPDDR